MPYDETPMKGMTMTVIFAPLIVAIVLIAVYIVTPIAVRILLK